MNETFKVFHTSEIDHSVPLVCGCGGRTIRLQLPNQQEVGFATTTYGFSIPPDIRAYGAERIGLALEFFRGDSNDQIQHMLSEMKRKRGKADEG